MATPLMDEGRFLPSLLGGMPAPQKGPMWQYDESRAIFLKKSLEQHIMEGLKP